MSKVKSEVTKTSKTPIIVAVVVIVVAILITIGYFVNTGLQVKANINDNAKILSENSDLINQKLNQFSKMNNPAASCEVSE